MLGVNVDLTPLVDPGSFKRYYAFRDSQKDKALEDIRNQENRYQTIGLISSVPFVLISAKQRDVKWFLPGLLLIGGFKWYSGQVRQDMMKSQRVDDYWRKSKKLDFDLKKTEQYIEQRKLFEKYSDQTNPGGSGVY